MSVRHDVRVPQPVEPSARQPLGHDPRVSRRSGTRWDKIQGEDLVALEREGKYAAARRQLPPDPAAGTQPGPFFPNFRQWIPKRCKGVHCVDLGESFPTSIYLQNLALIQPRTSLFNFD